MSLLYLVDHARPTGIIITSNRAKKPNMCPNRTATAVPTMRAQTVLIMNFTFLFFLVRGQYAESNWAKSCQPGFPDCS